MRIAIEGWPEEFVSSESMVRAPSGSTRARICVLPGKREEVFEQRSNPIDVIPKARPTRFTLNDHREQVTRSLYLEPTVETWLKTDVSTISGGTFALKRVDGIEVGTVLHVNREAWVVTAVDDINDTVTVTRGLWDTRARFHYTLDGSDTTYIEVTDRPRLMTGRYLFAYLYGEGDDPTGEGVLFWRGRVSSEPKGSGDSYSLYVDPVTRVLEGVLGQGLGDPLSLRGVVYHRDSALLISIRVHSSTSRGSSVSDTIYAHFTGASGPYETQGEFGGALQDSIDGSIAGHPTGTPTGAPLVSVITSDNDWHFEVEINSTTARYITIAAKSSVDGETIDTTLFSIDGREVDTVVAGERYRVLFDANLGPPGARSVPRGAVGRLTRLPPPPGGYPPTVPMRDIYLGGQASIAGATMVSIDWPAGPDWPAAKIFMFVDDVDTATRALTLRWRTLPDGATLVGLGYTAATMPEIMIARHIATGSIFTAINSLINSSATYLNLGEAPMLRTEDTDIIEWLDVVTRVARGRAVVNSRVFVISGEVEVTKWLMQELRLLGLWIGFDATGRFVPRETKTYALTDPDAIEVTPLDKPKAGFERQGLGSIKGAIVKTGYIPLADEHRGTTHVILDIQANSRNPLAGMMEIAPLSAYDINHIIGAETTDEVRDLTAPVREAYGYPYDYETFAIPLTYLDTALVGVGVKYTPRGREFPNGTSGNRDPVLRTGQIISRTIDFGRGHITLSVHKMATASYGYTPSYYIASETGSGTDWTLTLDDRDPWSNDTYSASADTAEDFLAVGDLIQIYEWNDASPTTRAGEITAVDGNEIEVTFTSSWTPGSSEWMLRFQGVGSSETVNMAAYAFYADEDFTIGFTSGDAPARRYAAR
jgi:hypothetical protein